MGIFTKSLELRSAGPDLGASTLLSNPAEWLYNAFGVVQTDAGVPVTPMTALRCAPFYACANVLAQSVAQVPWNVIRRKPGNKREIAINRTEHYLLHTEPNGMMSSYSFRVALMMNAILHGNMHAEFVRDGANRTTAIHVLPAWTVATYEALNRDRLYYQIVRRDGEINTLDGSDVAHIPCLSLDGAAGLSPVAQHRQGIGLALAAEQAGAAFFGNGSRPSGYLSTATRLPKEDRERLARRWFKKFGGAKNTGSVPILSGDVKWNQLSINPTDAQYIETRKYQAIEIARMCRVPGILIGIEEGGKSLSVDSILSMFATLVLTPWVTAIEQEFDRKLFPNTDEYYCKLDLNGLMRGDAAARANYYKALWAMAAITSNEIRDAEEMEPMDGGDRLWVQQGFMPLDKADEILAKQGGKQLPAPKQDPEDGGQRQADFQVEYRWLEDVCTRVSKWEKATPERIADAFEPVFRSCSVRFSADNKPLPNVTPFCRKIAQGFSPNDPDFAKRAIVAFAQECSLET